MTVPAWKSLPTWYLVAEGDQAIPPDAERLFAQRMGATTIEVTTNHVAMVSHPDDVVELVKTAAEGGTDACRPSSFLRSGPRIAALDLGEELAPQLRIVGKPPRQMLVTVFQCSSLTPRICVHRCTASRCTATPCGSITSASASAICSPRRS
jgi:hypothetical protein